jgi:hypothetical protein
VTIYADLYRPVGVDEPLPVLIAWSPYGKHSPTTVELMTQLMPGHDIDPANVTRQYHFEGAERTYWRKHTMHCYFPIPTAPEVPTGSTASSATLRHTTFTTSSNGPASSRGLTARSV